MRILIPAALALATLASAAHAQDREIRTTTTVADAYGPVQVRTRSTTVLSDAPRSPATYAADGTVLVAESVGSPTPAPLPFDGVCAVAHGVCPAYYAAGPGGSCNCLIPGFGDEVGVAR